MPTSICWFHFRLVQLVDHHGYLHCRNHIETKDYITSCNKQEQNYIWSKGLACFNGSQLAKMKKSIPDMSLP